MCENDLCKLQELELRRQKGRHRNLTLTKYITSAIINICPPRSYFSKKLMTTNVSSFILVDTLKNIWRIFCNIKLFLFRIHIFLCLNTPSTSCSIWTHALTHTTIHNHTHAHTPSAQAISTSIRRSCTWLRGIWSQLGFAWDGHVTLTIVAYPRVRLLKPRVRLLKSQDTTRTLLEKNPGDETPNVEPVVRTLVGTATGFCHLHYVQFSRMTYFIYISDG
jgi:hypothetical protein